jgi:hypothetical protein
MVNASSSSSRRFTFLFLYRQVLSYGIDIFSKIKDGKYFGIYTDLLEYTRSVSDLVNLQRWHVFFFYPLDMLHARF